MLFPSNGVEEKAEERHRELRKAVHTNRNLVSQVQGESRKSVADARRANFAATQAIELLEEARRKHESDPR
jgi:hypothetical protein